MAVDGFVNMVYLYLIGCGEGPHSKGIKIMKMSEVKESLNRTGLVVKYVGKIDGVRNYQLYWCSDDKQNGTKNYTQSDLIDYINVIDYQFDNE